jgi:hypothetical protein
MNPVLGFVGGVVSPLSRGVSPDRPQPTQVMTPTRIAIARRCRFKCRAAVVAIRSSPVLQGLKKCLLAVGVRVGVSCSHDVLKLCGNREDRGQYVEREIVKEQYQVDIKRKCKKVDHHSSDKKSEIKFKIDRQEFLSLEVGS